MEEHNVNDDLVNGGGTSTNNTNTNSDEHKKALMDLIESAEREIESLRYYISHYSSQVSLRKQKKSCEIQSPNWLAIEQTNAPSSSKNNACLIDVGSERNEGGSNTPIVHRNEGSSRNQHQLKSQDSQPSNPAVSRRIKPPIPPVPSSRSSDNPHRLDPADQKDNVEIRITGTKRRKLEEKHHKELIPLICKTSSPHPVKYQTSNHIASQHKRKLRSLALCPVNDKLFATSALDGVVNLWEAHPRGFVTGGTDHAVILWSENGENKWKPKPLHGDLHTSAVMGVAGMRQKHVVLSAGKDKRILGYDAYAGRKVFLHHADSKCLSLLPNPCDFNLFMVQEGTPEKQLRLLDVRTNGKELHAFGWKQERSESQSALTNQAWSPNRLYITSGSADPMIHIFDIRYNGQSPSQSIDAHQKRVFRAMWLQSDPLLISISSDLNMGYTRLMCRTSYQC